MSDNKKSYSIGFFDALAIVFIVLKLLGVINGAGGGYFHLFGFPSLLCWFCTALLPSAIANQKIRTGRAYSSSPSYFLPKRGDCYPKIH